MGYVKTSDRRVIEMLKALGVPEGCAGASIVFGCAGLVTVEFTKRLSSEEFEIARLFLQDKEIERGE